MNEALNLILSTMDDDSKRDVLTMIYIATDSDELAKACSEYRDAIGFLEEII